MQWFRAEICKLTLEAFHIPQRLTTSFYLHRYLLYLLLILLAISDSQSVNDQILPLLRIFPLYILLSLVEAWLIPHGPASLLLYCFNLQQSEPRGQIFMRASHLCMQLFSVVLRTSHKPSKCELFISEFTIFPNFSTPL